jgi:glycosyltransferase involved in cell wall biosynthesis
MAHIAIDARIINSSTGRYVERLLHYLEKIDTTNTYSILVPKKDEFYWKPTSKNFTVRVADFPNYSLAEQTGFKTFLNELNADLVHFCMPQQPLGYNGKTVTTFHDLTLIKTYNSDKNWLVFHAKQLVGKFVFKHVARKSDHIIAISEYTKKELVAFAGISPSKITLTYESGETSTGSSTPYSLPFKRYILYVGQQSDYKNIPRLAAAHQKLLETNPDLGLVLAGKLNDSAQRNKSLFEAKDYKNIVFTDFVADDQLNWLYEYTAAYVFPSLMEGFGLPPLEAMAHGAPVVSSNATCLPEVYGEAAFYFNPLDVDEITNSIKEVIDNESVQKQLIKNGYTQLKKYSWEKMAQETYGVYEQVLTSLPEK